MNFSNQPRTDLRLRDKVICFQSRRQSQDKSEDFLVLCSVNSQHTTKASEFVLIVGSKYKRITRRFSGLFVGLPQDMFSK